jgi:hypothetical protein
MKRIIPLFIFVTLFSNCIKNNLTLVKGGKSEYTIVIPVSADTLVLKAAEEFQKYVMLTSGAEIPVTNSPVQEFQGKAVFIGLIPDGVSSENEIRYVADSGNLFIGGGNSLNTLYSVYSFIEHQLGVRFLTPEAESIPKSETIELPSDINFRYTPQITTRTVHSRLFYDNSGFAMKHRVTLNSFPGYVPVARVHTFRHFLPEEKYYKTHPEYFALRGGKRIPTQPCLTNPQVFEIVKREVTSLLQKYPESNIISVSQNDNTQYCQCEKCKEIDTKEDSPAGSMIWFVNRIAKEFPGKEISTLAYQYTRKAPAHIKPEKNVLITLCSIECDRSAPIAEKCIDFATDLKEWGEISDNIRIWDYTTQFTNFLAPFPNIRTLQPNIQLFRDNNAKWIFEQHSNNPSELFELRSYLTAKLLWNPDVDADSIMNDFLTNYYQDAALYVRSYIDRIHDEISKDNDFFLFLYGDPAQAFNSFLKPELLRLYDSWYDEAEKSVKDNPEILKRVRIARISVDYAILEASRQNISDDFQLVVRNNNEERVPKKLTERLSRFENSCNEAGITMLNEMRYSVDEYLTLFKQTLKRAEQKNKAFGKPVTLLTKPKKYAEENPQTLTDGAYGGPGFYAGWLGFEGNSLEAVIDLEQPSDISEVSTAFLQVVNHLVFFPLDVSFYSSVDGKNYRLLRRIKNKHPLTKESKINDIQNFDAKFRKVKARYIKVKARNMNTPPVWHHGTGLPSWIFIDEVQVR